MVLDLVMVLACDKVLARVIALASIMVIADISHYRHYQQRCTFLKPAYFFP